MSESTGTSTPSEGGAPPPSDSGPVIGPAPASQPALTVSEAGRLLSRQRRTANGEGPAEAPTDRRPSPADMVSGAAQKAASEAAPPTEGPPARSALTPLERALGVPEPGGAEPAQNTPQPAADAPLSVAVEIEGQRLRTIGEVQAFVQRKSADYTQKTQGLAQERQALQAQQEALATVLPYIQPELAKLAQTFQNPLQMPDPMLAQTDPTRYVQERAQFDALMAEQQRLGNLTAIQQQAQARALEQQAAAGHEMLTKEFPFWADPAQRMQAQQEIVGWAVDKGGLSREELRNLTDPRLLKILMRAMAFDKMMAGAKSSAPVARTGQPVRGAPPPPAPTERVAVAEQSFDSRPNIRNAAALLAARRAR